MASTLDHIEKTLADSYRKEIDQEDNVWRTLPFFAATISFEIAALSQVLKELPKAPSGAWLDIIIGTILLSILVVLSVILLAATIAPAKFIYVSDEPAMLAYARGLDQDEKDSAASTLPPLDALVTLKATLADQYAVATHHNRQINQRRAFRRSLAGLTTFGSVLCTMFLVIRLMLHYIPHDL